MEGIQIAHDINVEKEMREKKVISWQNISLKQN